MGTSADLYTLWSVVCETACTDAPPPLPNDDARRHFAPWCIIIIIIWSCRTAGRAYNDACSTVLCRCRQHDVLQHRASIYIIIIFIYTYIRPWPLRRVPKYNIWYVVAAATSVNFLFLLKVNACSACTEMFYDRVWQTV